MPAPLTFAVEFSTAGASEALRALVSDAKSITGTVANILAPISPSNLVTQIAQQGLGINALGSNLVNAGIGGLANKFGYLGQMGAQFSAEAGAFGQTQSDVRQLAQFGLNPTDEMIRFTYQMNLAQAKAAENADLRLKQLLGPEVAASDAKFAKMAGTKFFRENLEGTGLYQGSMTFLDEIQHPLRSLSAVAGNFGANLFNPSNWRASALSR